MFHKYFREHSCDCPRRLLRSCPPSIDPLHLTILTTVSKNKKPGQLVKELEQADKIIKSLQIQALLDRKKIDNLTKALEDMTHKHDMAIAAGQEAVGIALDIKIRQGLVGLRATISRLLAPDILERYAKDMYLRALETRRSGE